MIKIDSSNNGFRDFKPHDYYLSQPKDYHLLPFRFHKLNDNKEVLVNEVGDYLITDVGSANQIVNREIDRSSSLYADLVSNYFISETPIPYLIDIIATRYRTKKSFLDQFTSLHLFVITLRCDHSCHYCQVSRQTEDKEKFDMSIKHIDKSIDLMFKSPSDYITMEFQGGEPLLAFDKVKYAIERANEINKTKKKIITFVICTNIVPINDDMLLFCKKNKVLISTSYDGAEHIHNANRLYTKGNGHTKVVEGIKKTRKVLGGDRVSALMTTTNLTLEYPIEIIDDYVKNKFFSIFLRPISPYGFAKKNEKKNKYDMERFIEFYKKGLLHIIDLNKQGVLFVEDYATIILRKILTPFPVGYVDLQSPAGLINAAVVYNYDGYVYASDESRMLAEEQDYTFRLGHVDSNNYEDIFNGEKAKEISKYWSNESLPGCSECGLQTYCGADPVYNYSVQGDMVGHRPTNNFCTKNMAIITFILELLDDKKMGFEKIARSWINQK